MSDQGIKINFEGCDVHIDRMFDIHDNQQVIINPSNSTLPITGEMSEGKRVSSTPLEHELLPIFLGDPAEVRAFLQAIDGARPTFVTQRVNDLLRQQKVTRAGCHRPLWEILNRYHLYKPSESNWNQQVNA